MKPDVSTLVNSMDPDQLASFVNRRSRSAGFFRSQLIVIHTVFNARCELVINNQSMKYTFVLVQGQVNINFQLVLNKMGPGRTSQAWYFHSHAYNLNTMS